MFPWIHMKKVISTTQCYQTKGPWIKHCYSISRLKRGVNIFPDHFDFLRNFRVFQVFPDFLTFKIFPWFSRFSLSAADPDIADLMLVITSGIPKCAWPHSYEWTTSKCIYASITTSKKSNSSLIVKEVTGYDYIIIWLKQEDIVKQFEYFDKNIKIYSFISSTKNKTTFLIHPVTTYLRKIILA